MPFQRPIFATLALVYCLCLGAFTLKNNPKSKLNQSFAFYNFSLALFNAADYVFLIPNHTYGLWFVRIAGIGSALMFPYIMSFVFELLEISNEEKFSKILKMNFIIGWMFAVLHLTPWMIFDVHYIYLKGTLNNEMVTPLYYLFGGWGLLSMGIVIVESLKALRSSSELQRKRSSYVGLASFFGFIALGVYLISLFSIDLPGVYYPLEALMAFSLAYAIFKHNLISVSVALKRASLLVGIYIGIAILFAPLFVFFYHVLSQSLSFGPLLMLVLISGILFSMGPIAYGTMVRRSAIFQDASTSHIAHEFKTPLGAIQSAKEILEYELASPTPDAGKIHDYLDMIQRNSDRLERFVLEILNTVKAGDSSDDLEKEEVDLNKLLLETREQFPQLSNRLDLRIVDGIKISAYQEGLRQILTNLLSNAARSCPEGKIILQAQKLADGVEIAVRDDGRGLRKEDLDRVFRPFVQSKEGKHIEKGTGLGLAIAQKWVRAHNGKIWAESEGIGKGAKFVVFLPF